LLRLKDAFSSLGMKSAFDSFGSGNFERMAHTPAGFLYISDVFHKTLLTLDEDGTEAVAATAVAMRYGGRRAEPPHIKVDRPFLFAVQHRASGACLFLGRVTDPRVTSQGELKTLGSHLVIWTNGLDKHPFGDN
jgi:serpin B